MLDALHLASTQGAGNRASGGALLTLDECIQTLLRADVALLETTSSSPGKVVDNWGIQELQSAAGERKKNDARLGAPSTSPVAEPSDNS